jgi:hypothetical protein
LHPGKVRPRLRPHSQQRQIQSGFQNVLGRGITVCKPVGASTRPQLIALIAA